MADFCDLYMNSTKNDFTIIVENTRIPANKEVLKVKSSYFEALFRYQELDEIRNNSVRFDTYLHSFIFVLKLLYGCPVTTDSWTLKSLTELIEMLIIIKRFFISQDIEELVTKQYLKKLCLIETDPKKNDYKESVFNNLSLLCESYKLANYYSFDCLLRECHQYFDENSTQVLAYFERKKKRFPPELMREIIRRNTFGVPEIKVLTFVKKLIRKYGLEQMKPMIDTIRFSLLTKDQIASIDKSGLFSGVIGDSIENFIKTRFGSASRVCLERERLFKTDDICYERATLSRTKTLRLMRDLNINREEENRFQLLTVQLPIETLINHIILDIDINNRIYVQNPIVYYFQIIFFSSDGQKNRNTYFITPEESVHEFYFKPSFISYIHIYCEKQILIKSLSYEMTSNIIEHKKLIAN